MSRDAFDRFADRAAYYFGVNENQAADLLDALELAGFEWGKNRLGNSHWGELAADLLDDIVDYEDDDSIYELEDEYDEWLDEGVEYELSAEYEETP